MITVLVVKNITHSWLLFSRDTGGSGGIQDFNTCFFLISGAQQLGFLLCVVIQRHDQNANRRTITSHRRGPCGSSGHDHYVRGIVGRPQLAKNNDCGNRRRYQCSFVQHQPPRRPTAQQRSFVAMEEHITVVSSEPGPCHRTLEVGTGLNHSKVGLLS